MDNSSTNTEQPGFKETIKSDFKRNDHFTSAKKDFKSLREFYISPAQKKRLEDMNSIKRSFFILFWILKSMILKLTPVRRLFLLVGILFTLMARTTFSIGSPEDISINIHYGFIGGFLILVVLMLELKDKLLAQDELEAGRKVQELLKPEENPYIPCWSTWLYTRSANDVSGDLVDYMKINENRNAFIMADVAGKGLKAALLTVKLQSTIRALAEEFDLKNLVAKVNKIFHRDSLKNIFASLLYVEINPFDNKLEFINAGHIPPLIIKSNNVVELEKGNLALGLSDKAEYKINSLEFSKGDVLFVYTDGLTEARNETGDFYGNEKLKNFLSKTGDLSAPMLGKEILKEIDRFIADAKIFDDLSIIILKKME